MENRKINMLIMGVALLLSSCVKDELYNTSHPEQGALIVQTDWTGISTDAVPPESYLLRVGEMTQIVSGTENCFKALLNEGEHTLLVQNVPQGITVGGAMATVNTLPDGTLEPLPGYLFSAKRELKITKDDTLRVSVKMVQSIRTLQLILRLNAGDEERIASTQATLTGIAWAINLATGAAALDDAKTVKPSFQIRAASPLRFATTSALASTMRLAGVANTSKQMLVLVVTLKNGVVQTVQTDLTELLKNFADSIEPLTLNATLELPKESDIGGTITDWDVVDNGNFPIS